MLSSFPGSVGSPPGQPPLIPRSVYLDACREAEIHKWIESKKAGRDLGEQAIEDWYRQFWGKYCRARRLEHLSGEQQWTEFKQEEFGQMYQLLVSGDVLLGELIERFEQGWENLHFMTWVHREQKTRDEIQEVIYLLEMININITRLEPRLQQPASKNGDRAI